MIDAESAARAIVEVFNTGDLAAIPTLLAEDYVDHQGLGETKIRGQDGFLQVVEAARTYRNVRITIEDLIAAGDRAALRLRWDAINDTGRTVTRETIDILRFVDGRLTEHWGAQLYRRED